MRIGPRLITAVVVACWVIGFILSRAIMLMEAWYHEKEMSKDDAFVLSNICSNHFIKSSMGESYSDVCSRARLSLSLSPFAKAVRRVVRNTYLCGDVSCISLLERGFATVGTIAMAVCAIVAGVLFAVAKVVSAYARQKRMDFDIESLGYQRFTSTSANKIKEL
jgi:hypothetical protein